MVIEKWYGKRPLVLENRDLDLAVAVGAAYYSYVRSTGAGLIVRGGLPRMLLPGPRRKQSRHCSKRCAWCRAAPKRDPR